MKNIVIPEEINQQKNELEKLTEFVNIRFTVSELEKVEQKSKRINYTNAL